MSGSDWRDVTLGELCLTIVDSEHKTAPKDPDGAHPLVRTGDLGLARANLADAQRVDAETHRLWTKRAVPTAGDVILAREAPIGGIYCVPDGVEPVLGQRTVLLRPDPQRADPSFLMFRLASADMQARMVELSTGATVPHLNMAEIRTFLIPAFPTLPTQRRIAALLSAFDELVEINERRIELLEDLARSLYREWFVHFRFPGHEGVDLVDSKLGPIPEGWEVKRLDEVAGVTMGQSPKSEFYNEARNGLPFHQGVTGFGPLLPAHVKYCSISPRTAEPHDVLCSVRAPVGRLNLADERIVIGRGLSAVRRSDGAQAFLIQQLRQGLGEEDSMGGGTIYKAITKEQLLALPVIEPHEDSRDRYEEITGPMLQLRVDLTHLNRRLMETRDLLLSRLVTGKLDISDIDLGILEPTEPD